MTSRSTAIERPSTTIVTIRHGATTFAHLHRIAGTLDIPLSEEGVAESRSLRTKVSVLRADVVVSSPLQRAFDTALLATGLDRGAIVVRPDCRERDYGRMQGLDPELIQLLEPRVEYIPVGGYEHSLNPPDGETFPELRQRAESFLEGVLEDFAGQSIMVFSHQTFLQQLHGILLGYDVHSCLSLDIRHLELNHFELDDQHRLIDHTTELWVTEDPDGSW